MGVQIKSYIHKYNYSNKREGWNLFIAFSHMLCLQPGIICNDARVNKKVSKLLYDPQAYSTSINKNQLHLHKSIDLYLALKHIHSPISYFSLMLLNTMFRINSHHKDFFIILERLLKVGKHQSAHIKKERFEFTMVYSPEPHCCGYCTICCLAP